MAKAHNNPNTTPSAPNTAPSGANPNVNTAPQPVEFDFTAAFDQSGGAGALSREDLAHERITKGDPKAGIAGVDIKRATNQVNTLMSPYEQVGGGVVDAAKELWKTYPGALPGQTLNSLNNADKVMPGLEELLAMARTNIGDKDKPADPSDEQKLFIEAMGYRAAAELAAAKPSVVSRLDYELDSKNPHTHTSGVPLTFELAQEDAIKKLRDAAEKAHNDATTNNDIALAKQHKQEMDDLDLYKNAFATKPSTHVKNAAAAKDFAVDLEKNGVADLTLQKKMTDQQKLDRVFATLDGRVKDTMKADLDKKDNDLLAALQGKVAIEQNKVAQHDALNLRSSSGGGKSSVRQSYDTLAAQLGMQELRVAQRIGTAGVDGKMTKLPRTAQDENQYAIAQIVSRSHALSAKTSAAYAQHRTFGDKVADFWAGKKNGQKEDRKWMNFARKLAKVGSFLTMAATGPVGFVFGAGAMAGMEVWSRGESKHRHELRTRTNEPSVDAANLLSIMTDPNPKKSLYTKLLDMQSHDKDVRGKDREKQQRRRQKRLAGAALAAAAVWTAPYWTPQVAHLAVSTMQNGWEVAQFTYGNY